MIDFGKIIPKVKLIHEDPDITITRFGDRVEYRRISDFRLHREDGPAVKFDNGESRWYFNGKLHREDGPAFIENDGSKYWYLNGKLHREDGPAIERPDGKKEWYRNGFLHREDGPAVEWKDGNKEWWENGKFITNGKQYSLDSDVEPEEAEEAEEEKGNEETKVDYVIDLPEDLLFALMCHAHKRDVTLNDLISTIIKTSLDKFADSTKQENEY